MKNVRALAVLVFFLAGCEQSELGLGPGEPCEGTRVRQGRTWVPHLAGDLCLWTPVEPGLWEQGLERRARLGGGCSPQPVPSAALEAQGNYYSERNGAMWLMLDAGSGVYRKLELGTNKDGLPAMTRTEGCWWYREHASGPAAGRWLFLDTTRAASDDAAEPEEAHRLQGPWPSSVGSTLHTVRWEDHGTWDWRFCPERTVPWSYCAQLRDGNEFFLPVLGAGDMAALAAEALLLRSHYQWRAQSWSDGAAAWGSAEATRSPAGRQSMAARLSHPADPPPALARAMGDWARGLRPTPPDLNSQGGTIGACWHARRSVGLQGGGNATVYGEACLQGGQWTFSGMP
ncbi:MAG: hypothetical protein IT285_16140 [Bdellovibrionales bacterium]|nr:hypothetical protein [Bdellovibrionales bacterium]